MPLRQALLTQLQRHYLTLSLPSPLAVPLRLLEHWAYSRKLETISIKQPIFIVGCHRSGTTVLYDAIATHPDLAYFTNASNLLPDTPMASNQICQIIGLDQVSQERFLQDGVMVSPQTPNEGIRIWERHSVNPADYCLDETYDNPALEAYLRRTIQKHLKYFNRPRFINKNPDNSVRIRYLNKLFPDAYFIHIVRDGRAVCSSLLKVRDIAAQFFGPTHRHATSGIKVKDWAAIKQVWDDNPVVGSGLLWREVLHTIEYDRQAISPDRFYQLRYEDFVEAPLKHLKAIAQFCQLPWDDTLEINARQLTLGRRNQAWRARFKPQELAQLMTVIAETMHTYGYVA